MVRIIKRLRQMKKEREEQKRKVEEQAEALLRQFPRLLRRTTRLENFVLFLRQPLVQLLVQLSLVLISWRVLRSSKLIELIREIMLRRFG